MLTSSKFLFSQRFSMIVGLILAFILVSGCSPVGKQPSGAARTGAEGINPPVARIVPRADTMHGDIRYDNYDWLKDRSNPEVIEYLEAENRYAETVMAGTNEFQEELYQEFLSRMKETDLSVPARLDDYYYYSRTEEGKQYGIYCRKKGSLDSEEEILLDLNELSAGRSYYDVADREISPDHRFLAYAVDTTGSEILTLYVKDLEADELLPDVIPNTGYSIAWASDNKTIFYTTLDEAKRPDKLHRHVLGTDPSEDVLVFQEDDDEFWLYVWRAKSEEYLLISLSTWTSSEMHYLRADNPTGDFKLIHPREPGMEYYVEHHGDRFFVMTNDDAENFKLMEAPVASPSKENWSVVIPHRDSATIDSLEVFGEHLVVYEQDRGLNQLRVVNLVGGETHYVEFPEPIYSFWPGANLDFNTNQLRFVYTSFTTPSSVFDYDMDDRTRELKKQYEVEGGYDPSNYQSERIFAETDDGAKVPISLVYRKGIARDGSNPAYMVGYGGYGDSYDPYFSRVRLSLLDRGFVYAIAHVRGGGEMGQRWHEEGRFLNKMNTFTDFVACAEHLIAEGYTSSEKLVISGGSAGGLLMGAAMNLRPDLFAAVIAGVPQVDVLNTLLDPSIPLTVSTYGELGNPFEKEYYDYIKSYSPYDNVEAKDYPHILITNGLNDPRVQYYVAAKWAAKLRALKTDDNILLLKTNMSAGHMGSSGRYDYLKEIAFEFAFILDLLKMGR